MILIILLFLPLLVFFYYNANQSQTDQPSSLSLIRLCFANDERRLLYVSQALASSPSSTILFHVPFGGGSHIITASPDNVRHILKTRFSIYQKGDPFMATYGDLFGRSIFTVDGDRWRFQRQMMSHEFTSESLRNFSKEVAEPEISERLLPTLSLAMKEGRVLDLEDVFKRFALDTMFKQLFGYDPECLSPSLPPLEFNEAYEGAFSICSQRVRTLFSGVNLWKLEKLLKVGSQIRLMKDISKVREFATTVLEHKRKKPQLDDDAKVDMLSRFLAKNTDPDLIIDIIIATVIAGRDSLSHALSRFFLAVATNPRVEEEVLKEMRKVGDRDEPMYNQVKHMVYTHAALSEGMRLDPPFPEDMKEATEDDVLPDGTKVRKGMRVVYSILSMGRSEKIWGKDCKEFKPERWLEWDLSSDGWAFIPRDQYTYTVFNAGPRICLGKEQAFMQMKSVIACVMKRFKLVAAPGKGYRVTLEERSMTT